MNVPERVVTQVYIPTLSPEETSMICAPERVQTLAVGEARSC